MVDERDQPAGRTRPTWTERLQRPFSHPSGPVAVPPAGSAAPLPSVPPGWDFLTAESLFGDLDPNDRQALEVAVPAVTYGAGRIVHEAGQAGEILYWLVRGRLRILRPVPGGRTLAEAVIEPGLLFGEFVLAGQRLGGVRVLAEEEAEVRLFRRADWERLLLRKPVVALRLLYILGQRAVQPKPAGAPAAEAPTAAARLAGVILQLADRHTGDLTGIDPERLAAVCDLPVGEAARLLDEFQKAGYLVRTGTRGRLRNPAALRRLADAGR